MVKDFTDFKLKIISLYREDYSASFHIRDMAKRIGTSHVALLNHLELLEQSEILIAQQIGRSKVFSLNKKSPLCKIMLGVVEEFSAFEFLSANKHLEGFFNAVMSFPLSGSLIVHNGTSTINEQKDVELTYVGSPTEFSALKKNLCEYCANITLVSISKLSLSSNYVILQNPQQVINTKW